MLPRTWAPGNIEADPAIRALAPSFVDLTLIAACGTSAPGRSAPVATGDRKPFLKPTLPFESRGREAILAV